MAIKVSVKSDPPAAAKGQFQCDITPEVVVLSQRKNSITIPVGTDARYAGKNRIEVSLPDCRLDIAVTKFGAYQYRLARDLAAYMTGTGERPVESSYALPWYFFAIAVLPLGIPVLTLGGAIPGALGCMLAMACLTIAQQEQWSTPIRLTLAAGVALLGYLGLGALIVIAALAKGM